MFFRYPSGVLQARFWEMSFVAREREAMTTFLLQLPQEGSPFTWSPLDLWAGMKVGAAGSDPGRHAPSGKEIGGSRQGSGFPLKRTISIQVVKQGQAFPA